jgi:hypothetical protein
MAARPFDNTISTSLHRHPVSLSTKNAPDETAWSSKTCSSPTASKTTKSSSTGPESPVQQQQNLGTYHGGIVQTPWFNNQNARQQLRLTPEQYNNSTLAMGELTASIKIN